MHVSTTGARSSTVAMLVMAAGVFGVALSTGSAAWAWLVVAGAGLGFVLVVRVGMSAADRRFLHSNGIDAGS